MKPARIIVLAIALVAGGLAFMLSGGEPPKPQQVIVQSQDVIDVLVAKSEIPVGRAVAPEDLAWAPWPTKAAAPIYITKAQRPNALEDMKGSVARAPFVPGEPIREEKLIRADGSGFMSAILPAGMRAVSTEISAETGAGGFILPNDRVDVILTRRETDNFLSETVLRNVRVLAIDQTVEEKNGQKVVVGKTATIELSARQAETLALSRQRGTLSLALRSLADAMPVNAGKAKPEEDEKERASGSINVVRFGVTSTQTAR